MRGLGRKYINQVRHTLKGLLKEASRRAKEHHDGLFLHTKNAQQRSRKLAESANSMAVLAVTCSLKRITEEDINWGM